MTANLSVRKATEYGVGELAQFFTRSFEGYFIPVAMSDAGLLAQVRLNSVDLSESRVVLADGAVAGVALMARRGWSSRVAGMGILPAWRGKGVGKYLMNELLNDARQRGDHEMELEVIVQNEPAVHLYESVGFRKVRRLVGLSAEQVSGEKSIDLEEMDIRKLAGLIFAHGMPDLPWQLSAETVAQDTPPFRAYRLNSAYALISDPDASDVRFYSLLVEPDARHLGRAARLIRAIVACHPGKKWHVPALFPEESAGPFEAAGFKRETLAQWQMKTTRFQEQADNDQ